MAGTSRVASEPRALMPVQGVNQLNGSIINATENSIFTAAIEDYSLLMGILREMEQVNDCSLFRVTKEGVRFITLNPIASCTQVSTFFPTTMFTRFYLNQPDNSSEGFDYKFSLRDFIASLTFASDTHSSVKDRGDTFEKLHNPECPSSQSSSRTSGSRARQAGPNSLYIQYRGKGQPLLLKHEFSSSSVGLINSRSELRGFEHSPSDTITLAYPMNQELFSITLNSNRFYDMVQGLDFTSVFIILILQPSEVVLKMVTDSSMGSVELEIADNSPVLIPQSISCPSDSPQGYTNSYRTVFLRPALQALSTSHHVTIRCNNDGLLCFEHTKIGSSSSANNGQVGINGIGPLQRCCSVEYYIVADIGDI